MENFKTFAERYPRGPITLRRPLRLFKGSLGLTPLIPGMPRLEFLVEAIFSGDSNQIVRDQLKEHFKNYENARRQRHKVSPTTRKRVVAALGSWSDLLGELAPTGDQDSLAPEILGLVGILEETVSGSALVGRIRPGVCCPHCGYTFLQLSDEWWAATDLVLSPGSAAFVDRLLLSLVVWDKIEKALYRLGDKHAEPKSVVLRFLSSSKHPLGQWFEDYTHIAGCSNLVTLATWLGKRRVFLRNSTPVSHGLLKKWACAQHLVPAYMVERLVNALCNKHNQRRHHFVARTCALICDVLYSATEAPQPKIKTLQEVACRRFEYLAVRENAIHVSNQPQP